MIVLALRERFGLDVQLKWPNDFLVGGLKLGGLLLDRVGSGSTGYIVAGLGVNLSAEPADFVSPLQGRATSLRILLRRTPQPAEVAGPILNHLGRELPHFTSDSWQNYGSSLTECDWLRGRTVRIGGAEDISGSALGISEEGALRVRTAEGATHYLRVGDVHLPDVATSAEDEESPDASFGH
jgi:BirA family biotin operon repressor/biotin-[acetyl-CoA-carboxylase] ligase